MTDDNDDDIVIDENNITVDSDKLEKGRLNLTCEPGPLISLQPFPAELVCPVCEDCDSQMLAGLQRTPKPNRYRLMYWCRLCGKNTKLTTDDSETQWIGVVLLDFLQQQGRVFTRDE